MATTPSTCRHQTIRIRINLLHQAHLKRVGLQGSQKSLSFHTPVVLMVAFRIASLLNQVVSIAPRLRQAFTAGQLFHQAVKSPKCCPLPATQATLCKSLEPCVATSDQATKQVQLVDTRHCAKHKKLSKSSLRNPTKSTIHSTRRTQTNS